MTKYELQTIVADTNNLARMFYARLGYVGRDDFKFYESNHPTEVAMWDMAVFAQELLADIDVNVALDCLGEWDEC
jgi:hypothetical protein